MGTAPPSPAASHIHTHTRARTTTTHAHQTNPNAKQAGAFKIGDTAGTLDNIVACKLYRPGSVGFVSKSGGMSNEMYNVLSRATDGLYEGARASVVLRRWRLKCRWFAGGWSRC